MKTKYLGDSVYADEWPVGNGIILYTNNGYKDDPRNKIFLEDLTLKALEDFLDELFPKRKRDDE